MIVFKILSMLNDASSKSFRSPGRDHSKLSPSSPTWPTLSVTDLFGAESEGQVHGLGAAIDLLGIGPAVASSVVGAAVEDLAAGTGAQGVLVAGEGIAPLAAQLVYKGEVILARC